MINTKALEEKYKDIALSITSIEDKRIEKLNYNLVKFEYKYEYMPLKTMLLGNQKEGVMDYIILEDECLVRVDKNLSQAVINKINNLKQQYNL